MKKSEMFLTVLLHYFLGLLGNSVQEHVDGRQASLSKKMTL